MDEARAALVERLAAFPERLSAAANVAAAVAEAPVGEWSPSEIVRHLVAVDEDVWHARLDQLAVSGAPPQWHHTEPLPRVLPDPSLAAALAAFARCRAATVARLSGLDDSGWARVGNHATYGLLDVGGLVRLAIDHDDEHLASLAPPTRPRIEPPLKEPPPPMSMPSSLQIAQAATLRPIVEIGAELGLLPEELELYGPYKAKISLDVLKRLAERPNGHEILITAITPTPLGEGKTTTTIGLAQGLNRIGVRTAVAIRQPSLGPVFGIKGGAAGGGYSQIVPMEDFNLHLTGDNHAVSAAHNLAAAFIDNHLHHGNALGIEPHTISWPHVVDISDRALRHAVIGLGSAEDGVPRETEWQISVASEVMAILALATDIHDLRARFGRIVVARTRDDRPVTLEDLKVAGAMTVLMRDAIKPNLLQTLEGGPAFVHAGPFANIAHGNSSVLADRVALKLVDAVCTEAGFGADMGAQKFMDIKCRLGGIRPSVAVVVATIRALKMHGGVGRIVAGKPLDPALEAEDPEAARRGAANLAKQIENLRSYDVPVVAAINAFPTDVASEVAAVREVAMAAGAADAVVATHFTDGGAGAEDLARVVWTVARSAGTSADGSAGAPDFRFLYPDEMALAGKIETIATRIYGADGVDFGPGVLQTLERIESDGHRGLPICMAKTHLSLTTDPSRKGRPTGFRVPVRGARLFAGAGFVTAYCGDMRTMPGLPSRPGGEGVDIDAEGNVVGLF